MFKKIWRRITGTESREIRYQLYTSINQFNDLSLVLDNTKRENALLKDALEKVTAREKELQRQNEDRGHNLIKWELKNQSLTEQLGSIQSENTKLREGVGHLLHGMAAVQDLSDSFVKRIDMIPQFFGLGEPLAKDILDGFAKQNKPKEQLKEEPKRIIPLSKVLTRVSYTLEVETTANCDLINVIEPHDVAVLIRKSAGLFDYEEFSVSNVDQEFIENIEYCGLFLLPVYVNDEQLKLKLWVVPKNMPEQEPESKATEQPEPQKSPENTREEPPEYNGDDEPDDECYFDDDDEDYDDDGYLYDDEKWPEDEEDDDEGWPEYEDDDDDEFDSQPI